MFTNLLCQKERTIGCQDRETTSGAFLHREGVRVFAARCAARSNDRASAKTLQKSKLSPTPTLYYIVKGKGGSQRMDRYKKKALRQYMHH